MSLAFSCRLFSTCSLLRLNGRRLHPHRLQMWPSGSDRRRFLQALSPANDQENTTPKHLAPTIVGENSPLIHWVGRAARTFLRAGSNHDPRLSHPEAGQSGIREAAIAPFDRASTSLNGTSFQSADFLNCSLLFTSTGARGGICTASPARHSFLCSWGTSRSASRRP
jgi:hypothetical protein